MTQDVYDHLAHDYSDYLKDFHNPPKNHTTFHFGYKPVLDIIEKWKPFKNSVTLDYGSGAGQLFLI